MENGKLKA